MLDIQIPPRERNSVMDSLLLGAFVHFSKLAVVSSTVASVALSVASKPVVADERRDSDSPFKVEDFSPKKAATA